MKKTFAHYFKIAIFYAIFFLVWRAIFLLVNFPEDNSVSFKEALPAFWFGLRMDLSIAGYILLSSLFFNLIYFFFPKRIIALIDFIVQCFALIIVFLVVAGNVALYHFWNSMINFRAVSYLADPKEIFTSLSGMQSFGLIAGLILSIGATVFIFKKWFYISFDEAKDKFIPEIISWVISVGLVIIGIRGGVQMLPMNESLVYYSKNNFLNQSAINPAWHLTYDIYTAGISTENPFRRVDKGICVPLMQKLQEVSFEKFPLILSNHQPNIVIIILESYTADVVASLGGDKRTDPNLEKLISEGILFDSIFASGTRTDQGIVSVLNGWPATPYHSIMRSSEKSKRLPSLVKTLAFSNYSTSFYYGGESNFSNLDAYCVTQNFNRIISKNNFDEKLGSSRWGVADEFLFAKHLDDMKNEREPFFSTLMTLSNHEPFDVPGAKRIEGTSESDMFRNSAAYTDACLGDYLKAAKEQPWYKNTLFVIVADHGHRLPEKRLVLEPNSRHIPLVFFGDVIKPEFRGMRVHLAGGHHDIPSTILSQMAINTSAYTWSKNLLNPFSSNFSFYQFEETVGFIENKKWMVYSYNLNKIINHSHPLTESELASLKLNGECYLQSLYGQYQRY